MTTHHTRQLRILFAADYFTRITRDANKIASASGLNVTEIFELCETPEWAHALRLFGYDGTPYVKNRRKYRKRKRQTALVPIDDRTPQQWESDSLKYCERLWHELLGLRPESVHLRKQNARLSSLDSVQEVQNA